QNMIKKTKQFVEDVRVEMKKVIWPEREQLVSSTIIVLVISAIFTLFIFFADTIISRVINILY
ncbi:MAG TPA: preprotein translocase subunit SecE, partial [candidate division Zixibacteria bacterium]